MIPGNTSTTGGPASVPEFKGTGWVNFNGGNRIIRAINARTHGGTFGPAIGVTGTFANFVAKVTGNLRDGTNWRWHYGIEEVYKKTAGYGGWATKVGGISGAASNAATRAYNYAENGNGASGTLDGGVTISSLNGYEPKPLKTGAIVLVDIVVLPDKKIEYWINREIGIDGTCP